MPALGPAAGPERRVTAAWARAISGDTTPPFDCMMRRTPAKPISPRRRVRLSR
jgi:hypothetical protein